MSEDSLIATVLAPCHKLGTVVVWRGWARGGVVKGEGVPMTTEDKVIYAIAVLVMLTVLVIVLDVACVMAPDMPLAEVLKRAVARVAGMEVFRAKPVTPTVARRCPIEHRS